MNVTDCKAIHQAIIILYTELIKEQDKLYGICPLSDALLCDGFVEHCRGMSHNEKCPGCLKQKTIYERHIKELDEMYGRKEVI